MQIGERRTADAQRELPAPLSGTNTLMVLTKADHAAARSSRIRPLLLASAAVLVLLPAAGQERARADISQRKIDEAIDRGVAYLKKNAHEENVGRDSLALLAILKGGEPVESPVVADLLGTIVVRIRTVDYDKRHHFYQAGVELMILEAVDPVRYRGEIEKLAQYILQGQAERGSWWYPNRPNSQDRGGDTSITQYAMLGLWTAARAGRRVPFGVWDRCAAWHIKTQLHTGAFVYHPGENLKSLHSMTVNGVASMCIARMFLFPDAEYSVLMGNAVVDPPSEESAASGEQTDDEAAESSPAVSESRRRADKYRFLQEVDPVTGKVVQATAPQTTKAATGGVRTVKLADLDQAIAKGLAWMDGHFSLTNVDGSQMYYIYGLERMAALADVDTVGGQDWFQAGAKYLVGIQRPDGSIGSSVESTSFAILFLSRATGKLLNRTAGPEERIAGGLLAGGRGLPKNLAQVQMKDGEIKERKLIGPIDELLAELENPKSMKIEAAQTALVEQVQIGDRESLIGQEERLRKLLDDPRVEVRRTAVWALGRGGTIRVAPELIHALSDPDLSVVVEAHNALCWLSRKPTAFGLPAHPNEAVSEDATAEQKRAGIQKWRADVLRNWRTWYMENQPYDERDRLLLDARRPTGR